VDSKEVSSISDNILKTRLNARELLLVCVSLVIASIMITPVCQWLGIKSSIASTLSSLTILGCIVTAFVTTHSISLTNGDDTDEFNKRQ
jgi:Na+/melibiose symporter-like transporter